MKKKYPTKLSVRFLVYVVISLFTFVFRVRKKMPQEVKDQKAPYLVLSNHVGFWDPFIIGNCLPSFTHFVSSESVFSNPFFRFFLTSLGTIPTRKNTRDSQMIRDIIAVIRQGENVGVFPEAVRNWAGTSFTIDRSIVKLIKLLQVPVVVATLKGMNLLNPRWSKSIRYTKLEVVYSLLLTEQQITQLSVDDIYKHLTKALHHDEIEYQQSKMNRIWSNRKAEHISHALYLCPECKAIDSFRCKGNDFKCTYCDYHLHINNYGFFERTDYGELYFNNIRDWYYWQEKYLVNLTREWLDMGDDEKLFEDKDSLVFKIKFGMDPEFLGKADLALFKDKIKISYSDCNNEMELNYNDIQTINPQLHECLEIIYQNEVFRIVGGRDGVSALKWEVAVNAIWDRLGQKEKLSTYINLK